MAETVAIITRTKDRLPLLKRAVASVLAQEYTDWVHVIVNDGGDATALDAFLEPYQERYDDRLHVIHLKRNVGMQNAANRGIEESHSTYITIHDDDDAWHPAFLKSTVAFFRKQGSKSPYRGVITQSLKITESIGEDGSFKEIDRKPYVPLDEISFFRVGYENPFPPIAFLYQRGVHDEIGFFEQRWEEAGDFDFNIRFLQHYEIGVIPKPYAYYHFRTEQTGNLSNSQVVRARETHRRVSELKNHYLRGEQSTIPPTTALALQIAYFLVENQWKTNSNYEAINRLDQRVHVLLEELCGETWRDRFTTVREGLVTALDYLKTLEHDSKEQTAALGDTRQQIAAALTDTHTDLANKLDGLLAAQTSLSEHVQQHAGSTERTIAYLNELLEQHLLPAATDTHTDLANKLNALLEDRQPNHAFRAEMEARLTALQAFADEQRQEKTLLCLGPIRLSLRRKPKSRDPLSS